MTANIEDLIATLITNRNLFRLYVQSSMLRSRCTQDHLV